jgi:RimJ/RimL family protein N-acetyltransferase
LFVTVRRRHSEVVTIEPLRPEQYSTVAGWLSRPEINRWLTADWRNRPVNDTLIAMVVRNHKRNRLFLVRDEGHACGLASLADLDVVDRTAMVWYALGDSRLSGQGVTSEAVRQLARLSVRELGLASLYAWVMQDNIASLKVMHKAGFREAGRIRSAALSGEKLVDRIYFDLIASEIGETA